MRLILFHFPFGVPFLNVNGILVHVEEEQGLWSVVIT